MTFAACSGSGLVGLCVCVGVCVCVCVLFSCLITVLWFSFPGSGLGNGVSGFSGF